MSVKKMKNNDQVYDILLPPTGATTLPLDLFGCFPAFLLNWLVIYVKVITLGVGILRESSSGSKGRHRTHPSLKNSASPEQSTGSALWPGTGLDAGTVARLAPAAAIDSPFSNFSRLVAGMVRGLTVLNRLLVFFFFFSWANLGHVTTYVS